MVTDETLKRAIMRNAIKSGRECGLVKYMGYLFYVDVKNDIYVHQNMYK